MPRYFPAPGTPFSQGDAEEIGPELARLAQSGASTPADIVAYAERADTPLRKHLHMDRPLAEVAHNWYRRRARKLASSIMVTIKVGDRLRDVRAFHSVTVATVGHDEDDPEPPKRRYVTVQQVRDTPAMAGQVLDDALSKLQAWEARYELYREAFTEARPEMADVFDAIDHVT